MSKYAGSSRDPSYPVLRIQLGDMPRDINVLARILRPMMGAEGQLSFDLFNDILTIEGADAHSDEILKRLHESGISASLVVRRTWGRAYWPALVVAAAFLGAAALVDRLLWNAHDISAEYLEANGQHPVIVRVLCGIAMVIGVALSASGTWRGIRQRRLTSELWFTVVTAVAVTMGAWFSGAAIAMGILLWNSRRRRA